MTARLALLILLCAAGLSAQTVPQLDKSKPPERPLKAPARETIDPKDYPRYTPAKFTEGPVANWSKVVKPEIVVGDPKKMKNPKTNTNWNNKYTLKYESITDANKKVLAHGYSKATWNSTGKVYSEGTWRNEQKHGVWTFYSEQGVLELIQCYKEGKLGGPYAKFNGEALLQWGPCSGGLFAGEFRYFHADGWLQYRVLWENAKGKEQKAWERFYNAKGELGHLWNYVDGKLAGDEFDWVDPTYDDAGKLTNPGSARRYEIEYRDQDRKMHGWQSFYNATWGHRQFDTWYEHGEQTGPYFENDTAGKQILGGNIIKGIITGPRWEIHTTGNRDEYTLDEKGVRTGDFRTLDPKGNVIVKGRYKDGQSVGTWVYAYETYTETSTYAEGGTGLHGPYSKVETGGKVLSKGSYDKGKRAGPWVMSDVPWDLEDSYYISSNDTYWRGEGDYRDDSRSGKWVWKRDDGTLAAEGTYDSGFRDGDWKFYHPDGKTLAGQGSTLLNLMSGNWTFNYANGKKSAEGAFSAGKETGTWVTYYDTGTKASEGTYQRGGAIGEWRYYHLNGNLKSKGKLVAGEEFLDFVMSDRVGEWDDFNEQGELIRKTYYTDTAPETVRGETEREAPLEKTPDGVTLDPALASGTWATYRVAGDTRVLESRFVAVNGLPAGKVQQYWPTGKLGIEGLLYGETREGLWKYWYESGVQKEEATFVKGVVQGQYKSWRTDGTLSSVGNYEAAKKRGLWIDYHPDGKTPIREATYGTDEKYDGPLVDYYADGKVQQKGSYVAGKDDGLWEGFYKDGKKRYVVNYKEGKRDGLYQSWHANGQKESEYTYVDGDFDGVWQLWYENGQLSVKGTFTGKKPVGDWNAWHKNGKQQYEHHYDEEGNPKGKWTDWKEDGTIESEEEHG